MWEFFKDKVKKAEEECIPKKTVVVNGKTVGSRKVGLDGKTRSKIRRKERLWKRYCATRDGTVHIEYRRTCNQIRNLTRKIKKNVEKSVAKEAKKNPKKFWQYVSKNTKSKDAIPDLYCDDSAQNVTCGDSEKAKILNEQFVSAFTVEDAPPDFEIPSKTDKQIPKIIIEEKKSWTSLIN